MYKVLLIDDETIIMRGIQSIIEGFDLGFSEFLIVDDGKQALDAIEEYVPDVIFTDIRMPHINGIDMMKCLRAKNSYFSKIPVVFVSGFNDFEYAKQAIEFGVCKYILKPVDKQEIFDVLIKIRNDIEKNRRNDTSGLTLSQEDSQKMLDLLSNSKSSSLKAFLVEKGFMSDDLHKKAFIKIIFKRNQLLVDEGNYFSGENIFMLDSKFKETGLDIIFAIACEIGYLCLVDTSKYIDRKAKLSFLHKDLTDVSKCDVYIFKSKDFIEENGMIDAFSQIDHMQRYMKKNTPEKIFRYEDTFNYIDKGPSFKKNINDIIVCIEKGQLGDIIKNLYIIKSYIESTPQLSVDYIDNVYQCIGLDIYKYFYTPNFYGMHPDPFNNLVKIKNMIDICEDYDQAHFEIKKAVLEFYHCYDNYKKIDICKSNFIEKAKKYLEEHYMDTDVSLNAISEKLDISPTYFSMLFKKEVGMGFNEYLSKLRINISIKLLRESDLNIKEVSRSVGYLSEKHFFVVFKKQMNISPGKFRKEIKHSELETS